MHTIESITRLIQFSDEAVKRAITALAPQGFDGPDAEFLADIYRKLPLYQNRMTTAQYYRARKALPAYVGRLLEIANGGMGEVAHAEPQPQALEDLWGIY